MPSQSTSGKVLVVGGVSIDLVAYSKVAPQLGETVIGDDFGLVLGGKGSNQAIAAALAGTDSYLVSCIGDDIFSSFANQTLNDFGVKTQFLKNVSGPTGIAHIRVGASGDNDIVVVPLANSKISKDQIDSAFASEAKFDVLLVQLEIPWNVNRHAIARAKETGATIILDPAPAMQIDESAWRLIDIVTPNETEAKALTGVSVTDLASAELAGKWFLDRGVGMAAITVGADGIFSATKDGIKNFPAPKVSAVDTTAAGDAFAGYLGALISQGNNVEEALADAVVAASISVTRAGASSSLPSRAEIVSFKNAQAPSQP